MLVNKTDHNLASPEQPRDLIAVYDEKCLSEFSYLLSRVDHLFISIDIDCPYGLPQVATFHQATFAPLSERAMELFLSAGYRRNGNCLYDMQCERCRACTPIRVHPGDFEPNRNQLRAISKNSDIETKVLPLRPDAENLTLCEKFLQTRYPKDSNSAHGYFRDFFLNNIVNSARVEYWLNGQLVGSSIVDIGVNWLNAVYFYFDPELGKRSLGTYNILHLIELCRQWDIDFLYLGYSIESVSAMNYKNNFRPHYLLHDGLWYRQDS